MGEVARSIRAAPTIALPDGDESEILLVPLIDDMVCPVHRPRLRDRPKVLLKVRFLIMQVPTVAEQGFPGFEAVAWFGLITRSGVQGEQVARVHQDVAKILADPTFVARLEEFGLIPVGSGPQEFGELIPREIVRVQAVLGTLGLKAR